MPLYIPILSASPSVANAQSIFPFSLIYASNSFKFFAIGDDVKNDLEPWKKEYKAETYLINNKSDSDFVDFQLSIEDSLEKIVNQT